MEDKNEYFTVKSSVYVRHVLSIWLGKKWWVIALPLAVFLSLGLRDDRWLIVALMFVMIILPGILALVYFNFALSPKLAVRTLPHKITLSQQALTITYLPHEESGYQPRPEEIKFKDIQSISDTGSYLIIRTTPTPYSILIVPTGAPVTTAILESWHNFC